MAFDLGNILQQYLGGASAPPAQAEAHFDQAAQAAPADVLTSGLAAMFRSGQTPPFGQMAGQLFGRADPNQQAGMVNSMLGGMGPSVLASLAAQGGTLGGLLSQLTGGGGGTPSVTPAQASQLSPDQVQVIASHAEQANPGIVDRMSEFYAQHPTLVKTVGGAALSIALSKMAERTGS